MEIRNDRIWLSSSDITSAQNGYYIRGEADTDYEDFLLALNGRLYDMAASVDDSYPHDIVPVISIPYRRRVLDLLTECIEIERIASQEMEPLVSRAMSESPMATEARKERYKREARERRKSKLRVVRD